MQFAIDLPPFGPFSDPHLVAQLAQEAEEAGWHGFFLWDHLNYRLDGSPEPMEIADPWIMLAAMAMRTTSIKLGSMVTPLPRLTASVEGVWCWGLAWAVTMMENIPTLVSQQIQKCME